MNASGGTFSKDWKERYSYWVDRRVGDYIYRYGAFDIKRCRADDMARHFRVWRDFETQVECGRAWRDICDRSFQGLEK